MVIVDKRVRLLQEILQGIRVMSTSLRYPAVRPPLISLPLLHPTELMQYEPYFEDRVMTHRREEVEKLRRNCVNRAVMNATMASVRASHRPLTTAVAISNEI